MEPFYDPKKSYEENFKDGPFGAFAQGSGNPKGVVERGESSLSFDFLGFKVNSPFGIAAGPLINGKFVKGIANLCGGQMTGAVGIDLVGLRKYITLRLTTMNRYFCC